MGEETRGCTNEGGRFTGRRNRGSVHGRTTGSERTWTGEGLWTNRRTSWVSSDPESHLILPTFTGNLNHFTGTEGSSPVKAVNS